MALLREYRYRQLFPISHREYLEEPRELIEWLLQVDNVYIEKGSK